MFNARFASLAVGVDERSHPRWWRSQHVATGPRRPWQPDTHRTKRTWQRSSASAWHATTQGSHTYRLHPTSSVSPLLISRSGYYLFLYEGVFLLVRTQNFSLFFVLIICTLFKYKKTWSIMIKIVKSLWLKFLKSKSLMLFKSAQQNGIVLVFSPVRLSTSVQWSTKRRDWTRRREVEGILPWVILSPPLCSFPPDYM